MHILRYVVPVLMFYLAVSSSNATESQQNDADITGIDRRPATINCVAGVPDVTLHRVLDIDAAFSNLRFTMPVAILQAPLDDSHWFVVEKRGRVRAFPNRADVHSAQLTTVIDLSASRVDALDGGFSSEAGLLGIAFDPDYQSNSYVYLSFTATNITLGFHSVISRFTMDKNRLKLDPASERIILTIPQPFSNHNGGDIAFDRAGLLLIGMGDGGDGGDPRNHGQNTATLLGAMLRINVNIPEQKQLTGKPYRIPEDNPFAASVSCAAGACPEIFAWGLRNPWRWSFDRQSGKLWAGDVGQHSHEEIDLIEAGNNYGWSCYEGNDRYLDENSKSGARCTGRYTPPVLDYGRADGYSVTGGYVYHGTDIPALTGAYVFADFGSGRIWAVFDPYHEPQRRLQAETGLHISAFGESNQGELYFLAYGDGTIKKLVAMADTAETASGSNSPVSGTGCADATNPKQPSSISPR